MRFTRSPGWSGPNSTGRGAGDFALTSLSPAALTPSEPALSKPALSKR